MKTAFPDKFFADMKIADTGALEAEIAFKAGADLVTVMGAVDDKPRCRGSSKKIR
jgi:3-hexulose-6-phosphate synthase